MMTERMRLVARWVLMAMGVALSGPTLAAGVPADARQLVVVVTSGWDANQGELHTFDRDGTVWRPTVRNLHVSIGRTGSAWGIGLHEPQAGKQKEEGDGRSPAGIFALGTAFGYAAKEKAGIEYRAMSEFDYCIDVNGSPLYNRIVDEREVGKDAVAKSTEPMRRDIHAKGDQRYKLGFVIEHNSRSTSARGSCIFAHLWGTPGQTTAGCTAMTEPAMRDLLTWLDRTKRPVYVLLPYAEYRRLQATWNLPSEVAEPK